MSKVALVTGAGRGIGRAVAQVLAADGWQVAVNFCRNERAAVDTCAGITAAGGIAIPFQADVADEMQVADMFRQVRQKFGSPALLVNNAGVAHFGLLQEMTTAAWRRLMAVNLDGAFFCCREALPDMLHAKSGCIVNIASVWGQVGASCETAYSASKGGLIAMTKALAKEVGPSGIRVNCVVPGVIDTEMNARLSRTDMAALVEETPLGRIGSPAEAAAAVKFLSSDEASFITGEVLGVTGGFQ